MGIVAHGVVVWGVGIAIAKKPTNGVNIPPKKLFLKITLVTYLTYLDIPFSIEVLKKESTLLYKAIANGM